MTDDGYELLGQMWGVEAGDGFVVLARTTVGNLHGLIIKWGSQKQPNAVDITRIRAWMDEGIIKRLDRG